MKIVGREENGANGRIIRSGIPLRQSVRCLPPGQFEQIREMFDHRSTMKCHPTNLRICTKTGKFENVRELFYLGLSMIEGQSSPSLAMLFSFLVFASFSSRPLSLFQWHEIRADEK